MSARIERLRATIGTKAKLITDAQRLSWLNRQSFVSDGVIYRSEWARALNRLARHTAAKTSVGLVDAWFHVARALAERVTDPEDRLYGIAIAATANNRGVVYDDVETYLRLIDGYATLYDEWGDETTGDVNEDAHAFYEFVGCRLTDIETALENPLENDEGVSPDMLADPAVVVAAGALLWDAVGDHAEDHEIENLGDMSEDEVESFIDYGGHFLWACFHARLHGIERDELTRFVCIYLHEWFKIMDDLLRQNLLEPGVLDALCENDGTIAEVAERATELVAAYRAAVPSTDMTLTEYLNCCLAPIAMDA